MPTGEHERDGRSEGPGRLLAGRYRVVAPLGRGGMGVVWRAVDEVLGREVAVKELRTYTDADAAELAGLRLRMQREARAAARVRHPGVVAVHDVADEDGRPVIVMELIDGPSLDDVLRERGTLDPREAAAIGATVLEALGAAHRAGVLHRDVKPGNVLLDRDGRVVLTDFGIAAMDDPGDGSSTHLTRSGQLVGSLDYLAPERAQGQEPGPASDVWALGATLYAAVEGASPFRRTSTWSTISAIVTDPLPEPRLAGPLVPVLRLLLHKDPARRPDAVAAARLLTAVADGGAVDAGSAERTAGAGSGAGGDVATVGLKPAAVPEPPPRVPTTLDAQPHRPEGFGPASAASSAASEAVPPVVRDSNRAPDPGAGVPRRGTSRSKVLIAAGVVAVLLVGGGLTYALIGRDKSVVEQRVEGSAGSGSASPESGRSLDPGSGPSGKTRGPNAGAAGQGDKESATPDAKPPAAGKGDAGAGGSDGVSSDSGGSGGGGASGGSSGGGSTGATGGTGGSGVSGGTGAPGGGSDPEPEPVCHSVGGGKYNCEVYRAATSYTASGAEAGVLNAGTNYFYCQQNLGRRETSGRWTNTWWAKTDDDSGNTGVFISDVYIQGGDNDRPLPGLPEC
ncbi:serine/threonine-protein kinase [Streptomyces sp. NPDC088400]|uniref:serine/threonine-protein kinase n=1 Tax=Streptomyces sp. NPDC088400 TaxID=3365861 RepID=UPI003814F64F